MTQPDPEPRWASIETAAKYVELSKDTIRRAISDGLIGGYKFGRRALRVDLNEIDAAFKRIPTA